MSGKGAKGLSGKGAKGVMAKGDKKKPISRSIKAGLQFPVGRIHRFLKVRTRRSAPPRAPGLAGRARRGQVSNRGRQADARALRCPDARVLGRPCRRHRRRVLRCHPRCVAARPA